jgi:hypothetical protein
MSNKHQETEEEKKERKAFIAGLIARGQAAERDKNGKLPAKATHEIIGYETDGTPIVKRVKFF